MRAEVAPDQDPGSEDFQWPEVSKLRPADAGRLLDDIERMAREANARADLLKRRKAQAKQIAVAVLEEYELDALPFTNAEGRKVRYTPYDFDVFDVPPENEAKFKAWADAQHESYYDSTPRRREGIFLEEMRRRLKDGEPMPPGVRRWTDTRLSRSATKG